MREPDLVRSHLETAWKLGYPTASIRREEWLMMAQNGQLRAAEPHLTELLVNPGDDGTEICEAYVEGFFLAYRISEALGLLEVWQADFPTDPQPHFMRGLFHAHNSNPREAVTSMRRAIELGPDRKDIQSHFAELLMVVEQYDEAAQFFRRLLKSDANNPVLLAGLGRCLLERGELDEGRRTLEKAILADPESHAARTALGKLELKAGRPGAAIECLRPVVEARPFDPEPRLAIATALRETGAADEAKEHLLAVERSLKATDRMRALMDQAKSRPTDTGMRFEIGMILMKNGAPNDGAKWLLSVLDIDPRHHASHDALAEYYRSIGKDKLADEHQRQADSAVPNEKR
jgi:Tfp pilus assembly protein PilF